MSWLILGYSRNERRGILSLLISLTSVTKRIDLLRQLVRVLLRRSELRRLLHRLPVAHLILLGTKTASKVAIQSYFGRFDECKMEIPYQG